VSGLLIQGNGQSGIIMVMNVRYLKNCVR